MTPTAGMTPKEELATIDAQIKALEARRAAIYRASVETSAEEKVCDDWMAKMLGYEGALFKAVEYPITVTGITHAGEVEAARPGRSPGTWVAVRPCEKEHAGETFLGVYLGDLALGAGVTWHPATGVLAIRLGMHNPAMWVPDLRKIVYGCGSWWRALKTPADLAQISDADINDVWYVQALKTLSAPPPAAATADDG